MQTIASDLTPEIYQGQFGTFSITDRDRQGVVVYRSALMVAAISFGVGTLVVLLQSSQGGNSQLAGSNLVTWLATIFSVALGVALATIHIYLAILHRVLQAFWAIGCVSAIGCSLYYQQPIGEIIARQPLTILGIGFTFAALTGVFFKEAFCFDRLETKILVPIVPLLLLGHLTDLLPVSFKAVLLAIWAGAFLVFAVRKAIQPIPPDIGDKSVFTYLEMQK